MRTTYTSDISREQFSVIKNDLEQAKKTTHPRKYDLYEIFCAVLYVLKNGCTWRDLPHDFPKWQNVYYHYQIWKEKDDKGITLLDRIHDRLIEAERICEGRKPDTTMIIVDAKSVKNTDTAEEKGYDAGKKLLE